MYTNTVCILICKVPGHVLDRLGKVGWSEELHIFQDLVVGLQHPSRSQTLWIGSTAILKYSHIFYVSDITVMFLSF